jgi:hypothetical protein
MWRIAENKVRITSLDDEILKNLLGITFMLTSVTILPIFESKDHGTIQGLLKNNLHREPP